MEVELLRIIFLTLIVNCLQFDEKKIIAGTASQYIAVLDFNTTQKIMKLKGHRHQVYDLVYNGDLVASCSADRVISKEKALIHYRLLSYGI